MKIGLLINKVRKSSDLGQIINVRGNNVFIGK